MSTASQTLKQVAYQQLKEFLFVLTSDKTPRKR